MSKNKIEVQGLEVAFNEKDMGDYINLTDIARWKNLDAPSDVVKNWMRTGDTIDFIGLWEILNNPDFNSVEFDLIKSRSGRNAFTLSPSQWVDRTNAKAIIAGRGKYSEGTFAHADIAMEFLSWISTEFKLYFIYEFKRLKAEEGKEIGWSAKRELAKISYRIQTDSIAENLIPKDLTAVECGYIYATEAVQENKLYRVIKTMSHRFAVDLGQEVLVCSARSVNKMELQDETNKSRSKFSKKGGTILAGDFVRVDIENKVILSVENRKNKLIRPAVSNIDQLFIVICCVPAPDFKMVDKMIINALQKNITPIICINKSDINTPDFTKQIAVQYKCIKTIESSAVLGLTDQIKKLLKNKLSVLAGQSAVGKSTIINALIGDKTRRIGDLSRAIQRGKNTTTNTELFKINGGLLADTPGFSLTELFEIEHNDLDLYYPEFEKFRQECKYHRCNHIGEPDCMVMKKKGKYESRYDRYVEIFNELKEKYDNKYR